MLMTEQVQRVVLRDPDQREAESESEAMYRSGQQCYRGESGERGADDG